LDGSRGRDGSVTAAECARAHRYRGRCLANTGRS